MQKYGFLFKDDDAAAYFFSEEVSAKSVQLLDTTVQLLDTFQKGKKCFFADTMYVIGFGTFFAVFMAYNLLVDTI
jgi:hypothetical protein